MLFHNTYNNLSTKVHSTKRFPFLEQLFHFSLCRLLHVSIKIIQKYHGSHIWIHLIWFYCFRLYSELNIPQKYVTLRWSKIGRTFLKKEELLSEIYFKAQPCHFSKWNYVLIAKKITLPSQKVLVLSEINIHLQFAQH